MTQKTMFRGRLTDLLGFLTYLRNDGVREIWADTQCPCGHVDYIAWELDDLNDMTNTCPECGKTYTLHVNNVHTRRHIR